MAVLTITALVFSMLQSLVVPALPTIQKDLGASATATTWLVTGFLLSSSIATPILGRLGDMFGRSSMLSASLALLAGSSVLAGSARSIELLVVARVLQGFAGAIVPLSFGIARDVLPPQKVAGAIGLISAMLAVGAAMGIVLSGPIAIHLGYQWLFWIPLIPLVPTVLASWRFVAKSERAARQPVDVRGAVMLTAWLTALLVALSQGAAWGWGSGRTLTLFAASAVGLVWWIWVEKRVRVPLIDIDLLAQPTLWRINVVGFATGFTMQATFTFVTRFVQIPESTGYGLGVSASNGGLVILPWSTGSFITGMISGRLAARWSSKSALVAGAVLSVLPCFLLATWNDAVWQIGAWMGLFGVGMGMLTAAMPAIIVAFAPDHQTGVAAGVNQNIRTIGGAVGTQLVAAIIASGAFAAGFPAERSYVLSFVVIGAVSVLGALAAAIVPGERRAADRVRATAR